MTLPTSAQNTAAIPLSMIAKQHRDGSVVLSTASDRIFKLNGVGALTWTILEQSEGALSVSEVTEELLQQFEVINRDGEMHYEISRAQLLTDTTRFLSALVAAGLVEVLNDPHAGEAYRIKEGVCGTTTTTLAGASATQTTNAVDVVTASAPSPQSEPRPRKWETLTAFGSLVAFDLLLRFRGFSALIRKVETWPTAEPHTTDPDLCHRVCAAVNRAQVYYPKKAMCLQHSAVVTCLLRRRAVPAEMVLAAQEFPPKAHAWVEVGNEVVNDKPTVREVYRTLRRI